MTCIQEEQHILSFVTFKWPVSGYNLDDDDRNNDNNEDDTVTDGLVFHSCSVVLGYLPRSWTSTTRLWANIV